MQCIKRLFRSSVNCSNSLCPSQASGTYVVPSVTRLGGQGPTFEQRMQTYSKVFCAYAVVALLLPPIPSFNFSDSLFVQLKQYENGSASCPTRSRLHRLSFNTNNFFIHNVHQRIRTQCLAHHIQTSWSQVGSVSELSGIKMP